MWKDALEDPSGRVDLVLADGTHLTGWRHADFHSNENSLAGKLLDLERAFRQIAVVPDQRNIAITAVWNPLVEPVEFYVSVAMPFGARNSVYGFNGFARCLQLVGVRVLGHTLTHFYDDFTLLEPSGASASSKNAFSRLLKLLGWAFKEGGDKDKPYAAKFDCLGLQLDLADPKREGATTVTHNPDRLEKIEQTFHEVEKEGSLRGKAAATLAGKLQFLDSNAYGRLGAPGLKCLRACASRSWTQLQGELLECLRFWRSFLAALTPRVLQLSAQTKPLLFFTDGAVELLPVVVSKGIWAKRFQGCRVLCFVDNDGARAGLIAATMSHPASDTLVLQARHQDLRLGSSTWYERVPSVGNPGDAASRLEFERLVAWGAVEVRAGVPKEYASVLEWKSHLLAG